MVLDQTDVDAEFPGLPLVVEDSGYVDNEAATEDTIDPTDTAADLTAGGRLDGYEHAFLDPAALFEASPAAGRPVLMEVVVDLFGSQRSAQAFLQRQIADFRRFQGIEIEEATLEEFQELGAPDVGTDAVAGRLTYSIVGFKLKLYSTFVAWIRGPVVARVVVGAFDDADLSAAVNRLARRMDQRIDGVLAGEIRVTPIIPSPTPPGDTGEAARREGFDLPAMLPTLADLPEGAIVEDEGFLQDPDAISAYQREFEAEGAVVQLGSSQLITISTLVELHGTDLDSKAGVLVLKGLDPTVFGELFGLGFAEEAGSAPESTTFEAVELEGIGDLVAGFLIKMKTGIADFDAYAVWFARGRIAANFFVMGVGGQVHFEDIIPLAQIMDTRIRASLAAATFEVRGTRSRSEALTIAVEDVQRVQEIRYLGNDQVHYLLTPSTSENELVAIQLNVHNVEATRVLMTVGEERAVELRGFEIDESYNHLDVSISNQVNVTTVEGTHPSENRFVPFIADPVELNGEPGLPQGFSIVGWVVFDVPKGVAFRELWWRAGDTVCVPLVSGDEPCPVEAEGKLLTATISTNMGSIVLELLEEDAPKTVENFIKLANDGFYDGVIFHRVIKDFMIQGGDPTGTGTGGPGYQFEDEIVPSLVFDRPGILAMANAGPNTNGSQFFITTVPTPHLNGSHTIFGRVTSGQDVVDAISAVATGRNDKPLEDVVIQTIEVVRISSASSGGAQSPGAVAATGYAGEQIGWTQCRFRFECGLVEVPADYRDPDAGSIRIAVNVHRATSQQERIGYLFVNPGGPGGSGVELVHLIPLGPFTHEIVARFDIIGFDPRGVEASEPAFACGVPGQQLALLGTIDGAVDTPDEIAAGEAAANLCVQSMGPVGSLLHSEYVARDMDEIRKALGADQISYLGFSYGSTLGVWYATLFPESVRAMVVDGADNPVDPAATQQERIEEAVEEVSPFAASLEQALAACDDPGCPIYNDGDPVAYFKRAVSKLDLVNAAADNHPFAGVAGVISTLYSEETWPLLWRGLFQLNENDDPSILLSFARIQLGPEPTAANFTSHVNCLDGWVLYPELDRTTLLDDSTVIDAILEEMFPLLALMDASLASPCPFYDQFAPEPLEGPLDGGGVPILVVGNRSDPFTPSSESEELVTETLSNGFLLETSHSSHVVYPDNECVNDQVHSVLIDGVYPTDRHLFCEREEVS